MEDFAKHFAEQIWNQMVQHGNLKKGLSQAQGTVYPRTNMSAPPAPDEQPVQGSLAELIEACKKDPRKVYDVAEFILSGNTR